MTEVIDSSSVSFPVPEIVDQDRLAKLSALFEFPHSAEASENVLIAHQHQQNNQTSLIVGMEAGGCAKRLKISTDGTIEFMSFSGTEGQREVLSENLPSLSFQRLCGHPDEYKQKTGLSARNDYQRRNELRALATRAQNLVFGRDKRAQAKLQPFSHPGRILSLLHSRTDGHLPFCELRTTQREHALTVSLFTKETQADPVLLNRKIEFHPDRLSFLFNCRAFQASIERVVFPHANTEEWRIRQIPGNKLKGLSPLVNYLDDADLNTLSRKLLNALRLPALACK